MCGMPYSVRVIVTSYRCDAVVPLVEWRGAPPATAGSAVTATASEVRARASLRRRMPETSAPPPRAPASGGSLGGLPQRPQCRLEAGELVEHRVRGGLHHLVGLYAPLVLEELREERDVDRLDDREHAQGRDHLLQLLHATRAGGDPAVGDEADRFVPPLLVQVVDRVLQRSR